MDMAPLLPNPKYFHRSQFAKNKKKCNVTNAKIPIKLDSYQLFNTNNLQSAFIQSAFISV